MDTAAWFVIGFIAGCFFSLVLSHFLAKKVGEAVYKALKDYHEGIGEEGPNDKDDPANWWKK